MKKTILVLGLLLFFMKGYSQTNSSTTFKVANGKVIQTIKSSDEKVDTLTTEQLNQKYKMAKNKIKEISMRLKRLRQDSIQAVNNLEEYNAIYKKLGITPQ